LQLTLTLARDEEEHQGEIGIGKENRGKRRKEISRLPALRRKLNLFGVGVKK